MSSLKQKTVSGVIWSAIDTLSIQGITFIVGIILARLLSPKEFGLIGIMMIFIAVSESLINSGFSQALIRKKNCTQIDYSTVFYYNIVAGIVFFITFLIIAPYISEFFEEPQLTDLIRVFSFVLIIDSFTAIQRTTLTKRIDFKLQTKISLTASIVSGAVGISMAYAGFGVWSLIAKALTQGLINSILLWLLNKWTPSMVFSKQSFKELFSFGYKLMLSGLLDTLYRNIYNLIIGKYFSTADLGYYTRAQMFKDLPSKNLNIVMSRVTYPVLSQIQDDKVMLKAGYQKMIKSIMYISMIAMAGLTAVAEPMIISLIGEQWRPSIIYLQLLTFVGMMYPLQALNLNMLQVQGRSDLFLRLEIIKKFLAVPVIIIGVYYGIKAMILGLWFNTIISYFLNSFWSGKFIDYPMKEQIKDIMPGFLLALIISAPVYLISLIPALNYVQQFILQLIAGLMLTISLSEIFKPAAYLELKEIAFSRISSIKNGKK